jgi:phage shock protein C
MYQNKIAGVCAGFARYLNMDVTLLRALWLIVAFASGGIGFIAYIVGWICMPREEVPMTVAAT